MIRSHSRVKAPRMRRPGSHRLASLAAEVWLLESRILLSSNPVPTVSLTAPASNLIGTDVSLSVSISNTGDAPGYGPYIDVILPATGQDGNNGLTYNAGSATVFGLPVTTTVLTFPASGQLDHPFAVTSAGTPVVVTGTPGDQLVVFQLPLGSFTVGQPAAPVNFTAHLSNLAALNQPLNVEAQGGFWLGADPLNDPTTDPSIIGPETTTPVTPTLFTLTKTYLGPEQETATGPNFPHQYEILASVAPGQTIDNFDLTDVLPVDMQLVSVDSVSGNGTTSITNVQTPSTTTPGGTLERMLNQVVGTGGTQDAKLLFTFYIPEDSASGANPVLDPDTGAPVPVIDNASAQGTYVPLNPDFPATTVSETAQDTLTAKSIAVQKTVADVSDVGPQGPSPGDTLQYTLNFQVSDYFAFQNVVLTDVFSDGQDFNTGFTPTLTYTQHGQSYSSPFASGEYTVTPDASGQTTVTLNISGELAALGLASGGDLLGASVPDGGTGGPAPDPVPPFSPGTSGTIAFETTILDAFKVTPAPGTPVVEGDILGDTANINGAVLSTADLTPSGNTQSDGTSASVQIEVGTLSKTVYAINGVVGNYTTPPAVAPGDDVTYQLEYTLTGTTVKQYVLDDYLPLPVFTATSLSTTFDPTVSAVVPPVGQSKFGPDDTAYSLSGTVPIITTDSTSNSVEYSFGQFMSMSNTPAISDILFTVQVGNQPFADQLDLTNVGSETQISNDGTESSSVAGGLVKLTEPALSITKGVVSTSDSAGVFSPAAVGPVTFAAPGINGTPFTGTINSVNLAATPISSTLSNIQATDLVKFAIVIENTGSAPDGAFDVAFDDTLPTGFEIPTSATGLNLSVTDGTGAPLSYTDLGGGLFGAGIQLSDPTPPLPPGKPMGSLAAGKDESGNTLTTGQNLVVVTYDLEATIAVNPLQKLTNTATLTSYANSPDGPNFVPKGLTAMTSTTIASAALAKNLIGTSIVNANNSNTQAVIGELVTFQLIVTVPQGTTPGATVVDTLPAGLAYVDLNASYPPVETAGVSISGSPTPVVTNSGQTLTFLLGTVIDTDTDSSQADTITITYDTVALNVASNVQGKTLTNSAVMTFNNGGNSLPAVSAPPVTIIEPKLVTTKTVSVGTGGGTSGQAGDTVSYTITIQQAPTSPTDAFNVTLADSIPTVTPGGVSLLSGANISSVTDSFGLVTAASFQLTGSDAAGYTLATTSAGAFDLLKSQTGRVITIVVTGTLPVEAISGQTYANTDTVQWTSLPGANPGQISPYNPNSTERTGAGGVNSYSTSATANLTVTPPLLAKQLVGTSIVNANNLNTQAVIGETVEYLATLTVYRGTTPSVDVIDTLPAGLAFVELNAFTNSDPVHVTYTGDPTAPTITSSGQTVDFNLGTITNTNLNGAGTETLSFDYTTVVLNVASNTQGQTLTNSALVAYNGMRSTSVSAAPVTVIEPQLETTKTVAVNGSGSTGQAGDTVSYTITIQQAATSATDAFNTTFADPLPTVGTGGPSLLSSPTFNVTDTAGLVTAGNFTLTGSDATGYTLATTSTGAFDLLKSQTGRVITIVVTGTLPVSVVSGQTYSNTDNVQWTSLPGTNPGQISPYNPDSTERTGAGGVNDYSTSASAGVQIQIPSIAKTLVGTSIVNPDNTNTQAVIGESVEYLATVTVPRGTTQSANVVDTLPSGLAFINLVSITNSDPAQVTLTGNPNDPTITNNGQLVDFSLGTVVDSNLNGLGTETLTFDYTAVVLNVAGNVQGTTLTNSAVVTCNSGATSSTSASAAPITVIEPELKTVKSVTVGDGGGNPGDPVQYTITIHQDPSSTTDAYNVTFADPIPTSGAGGSSLILGATLGVSDTAGFVTAADFQLSGSDATGYTLSTTGSGFDFLKSQAGRVITLTVSGTLSSAVSPAQEIVNTSSTQWTSLPGANPGQISPYNSNAYERTGSVNDPGGTANNYLSQATADFTVKSADLDVAKTVSDSTPNVGDTITYYVTLWNLGPDNATNVSLSDPLPAGLSFLGATPSQGTYDPASGTWTVGDVTTTTPQTLDIDAKVVSPRSQVNVATITHSAELDPDLDNNSANAVETPLAELALGGTVYIDANRDGHLNPGEVGVPGVTVTLVPDPAWGEPTETTTTAADGSYAFTNLPAGPYTLRETVPGGYGTSTPVTQAVTLTPPGLDSINFGLTTANVSGMVYNDLDDNGVPEPGEPGIGGVTVALTGQDVNGHSVSLTTTTLAGGGYDFDGLLEGTYTVQVERPAPYLFRASNVGSAGGTSGTDSIQGIPLGAGEVSVRNDVGFVMPASLSGYVYFDYNRNGVFDSPDFGIAHVTITLAGKDDLGQSVTETTVTGNNGSYQFTDLQPGVYSIQETQPRVFISYRNNIGSLGGKVGRNRFSAIPAGPGAVGINYNFGEIARPGCRLPTLAFHVGRTFARDVQEWKSDPARFDALHPAIAPDIARGVVPRGIGTYPLGPVAYYYVPLLGTKKVPYERGIGTITGSDFNPRNTAKRLR